MRTNFRIFGPTYDYDEISAMQKYKNLLHEGSLRHIQKFMAQQRAHLGGRKIVFNDKSKSHTIGELGCDFDNVRPLYALTAVSMRSQRSSVVGATTDKKPGTDDVNLAPLSWRH